MMESDLWNGHDKPDLSGMTNSLRRFLSARREKPPIAQVPRISIITPSFNQAQYIERTLLSILNQQYPNLEIIVIDGGSTDGSIDILRRYTDVLSHWSSESDQGQSDAINKGFAKATGDWVAFQNSDDIFLPGAFNQVARIHDETPAADVMTGHMIHIDASDAVFDVQIALQPRLAMQVALGGQLHNQTTFWRRELMVELGGMRQEMRFCFDYEYFTRMLLRARRPVVCDRYLGAFRRHVESKTSTILEVGREEHAMASASFMRMADIPPYYDWAPKPLLRAKRALEHILHGRIWYLARRLPPPLGIGAKP